MKKTTAIFSLLFLVSAPSSFASWSLPVKTRTESPVEKKVLSDRERLAILETQTHQFTEQALPEALLSIKKQLEESRAEIAQLKEALEQIKSAQQDQLSTMKQLIAPATEPVLSQQGEASVPKQAISSVSNSDELSEYQAAFALLQANKNQESLSAFQEYLAHFPQGKYTPNVLYWMASLELRQGQTNNAIARLETLVNDFASSQKAPSAWFKLAKIYHFQGNLEQAKSSLEMILSNYAKSSEAHEATELMTTWFH
jgi:tol-pal system protein YbgF